MKPTHWMIFPYKLNSKAIHIPDTEIRSKYPKTYEYLKKNKVTLLNKSNTDASNWWLYPYPKNLSLFQNVKLIVQVISKTGKYAYDDTGIYFTGGGNGPYYGIFQKESDNPQSIHYLQGILNSNLADFYLHKISSPFRGGYWSYGKRFIEKIPIRTINFEDPKDIALHDKMVALVEQMLQLHKDLENAKTPQRKTKNSAPNRCN